MVDCNYHDMSQIVNIWKFTLLNALEYDGQSLGSTDVWLTVIIMICHR